MYNKNGIVTGDNHSVSILNICMHYILLPLAKVLNKTVVFKRYADDITSLLCNYSTTTKLKNYSPLSLMISICN